MTLSQALSLIVYRWPFLVVTGVLGILAGVFLAGDTIDKYQVRAEILVVPSYEYTAPAVRRSTPLQITRIDLDELVNNEIQIMLSVPTIAEAARIAPPVIAVGTAPTATELLQKVAVRRVENTSVIDLQIIDQNTDWAIAFATALIEAYENERAKLFADTGVERGVAELIESLSSEIGQTLTELAEIEDQLFSFVAALKNAKASTPGTGFALAGSTKDQLRLAAIIARLETKLALPSGWDDPDLTTPLIGQTVYQQSGVSESGTSEGVLSKIPSVFALLQTHDDLLERLSEKSLTRREFEQIQRQNFLRLASNSGIHVLTPPVASERPVGLSNLESYAAMAFLGAIAGAALLLGFEALRARLKRDNGTS